MTASRSFIYKLILKDVKTDRKDELNEDFNDRILILTFIWVFISLVKVDKTTTSDICL